MCISSSGEDESLFRENLKDRHPLTNINFSRPEVEYTIMLNIRDLILSLLVCMKIIIDIKYYQCKQTMIIVQITKEYSYMANLNEAMDWAFGTLVIKTDSKEIEMLYSNLKACYLFLIHAACLYPLRNMIESSQLT